MREKIRKGVFGVAVIALLYFLSVGWHKREELKYARRGTVVEVAADRIGVILEESPFGERPTVTVLYKDDVHAWHQGVFPAQVVKEITE